MSGRILISILLGLAIVSGHAFGDADQQESRRLVQQGDILPLQKILDILGQEHAARILEVELEVVDGHPIYEIESLGPEGKVWEYKVDAATGEIIETELEE